MNLKNYFELLIVVGTLAAMMWGMLRIMLRDIHKDLLDIKNQWTQANEKFVRHEQRIDHLYHTTIELLKVNKNEDTKGKR